MKRFLTLVVPAAVAALLLLGIEGACNNVGDCPTAPIQPGGSCSGNNLQCPYVLQTPSAACDGTNVDGGVATSCICTSGSWVCPSPDSCEAGGDDAAGETGGDDATDGQPSGDDGSGDASGDGGTD